MAYKQIIIVRKDLNMSPGKLAVQVAHASGMFMVSQIRRGYFIGTGVKYLASVVTVSKNCYNEWIQGSFTKTVLKAKNKNHLLKAKIRAEELGMEEGKEFFLIYDECRTELLPEEDGKTLTCIGFEPMEESFIDKIGHKYQLYS